MYTLIFYSKINRKCSKIYESIWKQSIAHKDIEITYGKTELLNIYSVLNNKIEKCDGVESLIKFGSDGTSVMIGCKEEVASKLKRDNPRIISMHCNNHRLSLTICSIF